MRIRRCFLAVLMLAFGLTSCTSGVSAEDYFIDLETASSTLNQQLDDLEGAFNAGLLEIDFESSGAEPELIVLFRSSIIGTAASFEALVRAIEQLQPPDELAAPHEEALAAGRRVLADYADRAAELEAIDSLAAVDAYAEALAAEGGRSRFTESCRELQGIADRDGIDVDLGCS